MHIWISFSSLLLTVVSTAQEQLVPLTNNVNYLYGHLKTPPSTPNSLQKATAAATLTLPFRDDFFYATHSAYASPNLWLDSSVYINTGKAIAPPSLGVATLDGLNKRGRPYNPNLISVQSFAADTLSSYPINLFTKGTTTLTPADSVALTFYYQGRGYGDMPEPSDSLMVDFYKPLQKKWITRVWGVPGFGNANTNDSIFKRAFIMITDTAYLRNGFRFRFRNKAAINGDWDNWHVDYVVLDNNRSTVKDTAYDDVAFGFVSPPPLTKYTAMPWQHYNPNEQNFTVSNLIRYNGLGSAGSPSVNTTYKHLIYDAQGNLLHTMPNPPSDNITPFRLNGWVKQAALATPPLSYTFNTLSDSASFKLKHFIYRDISGATDINLNNDTVVSTLRLNNYFAFDDGSAERAYELIGIGALLAYKVTLNVTDSLRAVRILFDQSGTSQAATSFFRLCVWNDLGGVPGSLIYRDSLIKPTFITTGFNKFPEYPLTTPKVLGSGTYYIGIQKFTANNIVIGHDANTRKNNFLYFNTNGNWQQSTLPGALMMRFVFGKKEVVIGLPENEQTSSNLSIRLFPNPAKDQVFLQNENETALNVEVLNPLGQVIDKVYVPNGQTALNTSSYPSGLYICLIKNTLGLPIQQQRFIIQK